MAINLIVAARSDRGKVRERNEDSYCVLLPPQVSPELEGLIAVADGMGGYQAGEIASAQVTDTLEQVFSSPVYRQWVDYSPEREDYYVAVVKEILERINDRLYALATSQAQLAGMGTTATMALLAGGCAYLGHVGDSRAYLLRNGKLEQLTQDHSWVAEQVREGALSLQEAVADKRKNILTRALGTDLVVRVDRSIHPLQVGDVLVLCTDGLTNLVSDAEIQTAVQANHNLEHACESLVNLANQRGGGDNITVLVARAASAKERPQAIRQDAGITQPLRLRREQRAVGMPWRQRALWWGLGFLMGLLVALGLAFIWLTYLST